MFGADGEVGRADRPRRPRSRSTSRARSRPRAPGGPARSCSRCRRTCSRRDRRAGRAAVPRRAAAPRRRATSSALRGAARGGGAAVRDLLGGGGWTPRRDGDLRAFVEANALPAGAAFRRQDALDNDSPSYVGDVGIGINPALATRVRDADLLLVVGPRLGEMTTSGYTLLDVPRPTQTLVHVHPGAEELGRVYQAGAADPLRAWSSSPRAVRDAARRAALARLDGGGARRLRGVAAARPDARRRSTSATCIAHLRERVPDAIVTNGAGNFTVWVHRFWRFHDYPTPARADERRDGLRRARGGRREGGRARSGRSICFAGDGDFLMTGQELATAVQYELPIVVLVVEQRHVRDDPHAPGAALSRAASSAPISSIPDFAAYARAFGAHGETVDRDGAVRGRVRARARSRDAGAARAADRSRGDQPAHDAERRSGRRRCDERARGDPRPGARPSRSATTPTPCARATCSSSPAACRWTREGRLVGGRRRRAGAAGVREHRRRARGGGRDVRRRRQGDRLPDRRRRPRAHQPGAAGGLRRRAAGEHARRGERGSRSRARSSRSKRSR